MKCRGFFSVAWRSTLVVIAMLASAAPAAAIDGKLCLDLIRMEPSGQDAKQFSDPGWGGGLHLVLPMPQLSNMLAGVVGIEYVNLLGETTTIYESQTLLRVEQQTNQHYSRIYLGPEFGPHGNGTFRPHVGADIALVLYGISTDVVVPDDYNREQEIRQSLRDERRAAFGYDVNVGVDINPWNKVSIDVGARFLKSFNVPQ
ncbi:MAG: hypothetical protein AAB290_03955 [Candidatus Eisenbacteria bacterium]